MSSKSSWIVFGAHTVLTEFSRPNMNGGFRSAVFASAEFSKTTNRRSYPAIAIKCNYSRTDCGQMSTILRLAGRIRIEWGSQSNLCANETIDNSRPRDWAFAVIRTDSIAVSAIDYLFNTCGWLILQQEMLFVFYLFSRSILYVSAQSSGR